MHAFTDLVDLAAERLGGAVLGANDEFFAPKENLLKAAKPVFLEDKYTDRGKWMDGWETRRRRTPGHDWCIIRLGLPGILHGFLVDTSFFKGNAPERCSAEACAAAADATVENLTSASTQWVTILPESPLQGDTQNLFPVVHAQRFTHLRFNIFPDGGVARLHAFGQAAPDWKRILSAGREIDLAAVEHGGVVLAASDMFFGSRHNLIWPGRGLHMGDGWETKRRRGPGYDWCIVQLGLPGVIRRVEVDTAHFKGNFPESCSLEGCSARGRAGEELTTSSLAWREILPRTKLQADTRHFYEKEICAVGEVTHVRLNIFPDGGVSRLRVYGTPSQSAS